MATAEMPLTTDTGIFIPPPTAVSGKSKGAPQNLRPYQPGQSGNPGGKSRFTAITDALKRELQQIMPGADGKTVAEVLAKRLLLIAVETRTQIAIKAMEIILERTEGKVVQRQEISGPSGAPMQFESLGSRAEVETQIVAIFQRARERIDGGDAAPAQEPDPPQIEARIERPSIPTIESKNEKSVDLSW